MKIQSYVKLLSLILLAATFFSGCSDPSGPADTGPASNPAVKIGPFRYLKTENKAIPDNAPAGFDSVISISDNHQISAVTVEVNISHSYRGDLIIKLEAPEGTVVVLHNNTGVSADDIVAHYGVDTASDGNLADFSGLYSAGDWTLNVSDNGLAETSILNSWAINVPDQ